jgi:hypothetical protein
VLAVFSGERTPPLARAALLSSKKFVNPAAIAANDSSTPRKKSLRRHRDPLTSFFATALDRISTSGTTTAVT